MDGHMDLRSAAGSEPAMWMICIAKGLATPDDYRRCASKYVKEIHGKEVTRKRAIAYAKAHPRLLSNKE